MLLAGNDALSRVGGEELEVVGGESRAAGLLTPLGWLGVVLFVVGLIGVVVGAVIGANQGGAGEVPVGGGSLGAVSGLPVTESVGPNAVIGEVRVPVTVAVFAEPLGMSIARVDAGAYGLLESDGGWARVVLVGPDEDGFYVTGWVRVEQGVAVVLS